MAKPTLLYFTVLGLHVLSLFVAGIPVGATKLMIVPALGYAVWRASGPPPLLYVLALVASWVGDYGMSMAKDGLQETAGGFFTLGVVAFAVAHVLYTWLAVRAGGTFPGRRAVAILVTLAVGAGVLFGVAAVLLAYVVTILMLLLTAGTLPRKQPVATQDIDGAAFAKTLDARLDHVLYGALAFAASDALIGLQLAAPGLLPRPWLTAGVMILYGVGQWGLRGLGWDRTHDAKRL